MKEEEPVLALQRLSMDFRQGLSKGAGENLAEAARICFDHCGYKSRVDVNFLDTKHQSLQVHVGPVTEQMRATWADLQDAAETGAYGLAILLVEHFFNESLIRRSRKGTGFDYWIQSFKTESEGSINFFGDAKGLEVSGTLSGTVSTVRYRLAKKRKQVARGEMAGLLVRKVLVDFRIPLAALEERDGRRSDT